MDARPLEEKLDQCIRCDAVRRHKLVDGIFPRSRLPGGLPFMQDEQAPYFLIVDQPPGVLIRRPLSACVAVKLALQRRHPWSIPGTPGKEYTGPSGTRDSSLRSPDGAK